MFKISYRITSNDYDDFFGENGFFQISCNNYTYGEIYPEEIEDVMEKDSLYDWIERLIRVAKYLHVHNYVVLSDIESYNLWLEFKKMGEEVNVSIVKAEKPEGSQDIEFELKDSRPGKWINQKVNFQQFKKEIIEKGEAYLKELGVKTKYSLLNGLEQQIEELQKI